MIKLLLSIHLLLWKDDDDEKEINETLTKVIEKNDSYSDLNISAVYVPTKRKASLSPTISSAKSGSKSDSDDVPIKMKSNRKRRVI